MKSLLKDKDETSPQNQPKNQKTHTKVKEYWTQVRTLLLILQWIFTNQLSCLDDRSDLWSDRNE